MAKRTLPGLGLTGFWPLGTDGWNDENDANLRLLSAVVQGKALSRTTALPGSPTDGDIYIVPSGAAEHANEIAIRDNGEWVYLLPKKGFVATVADENVLVWYSGAAWSALPTGAPTPYDVGGTIVGIPSSDMVMLRYPMPRAVSFPKNLVGSLAVSGVAASASAAFSIRKNGVQFATMTFGAGLTTAVFVGTATSFAARDVLTIMAPNTPDTTLADLGFSLAGTRL